MATPTGCWKSAPSASCITRRKWSCRSCSTRFGIERPILFGHSDGGSIALIYAGTFPESPRALMLEAPHVFVEDLSVASIAAAKVSFQTTDFREKLAQISRARRRDLLGMERHLARSGVSLMEHRRVPGRDSLSRSLHSGRTGRVRHAGAGESDSQSRSWHGNCYACRLQTLAASRPAGEDAGGGREVCRRKVSSLTKWFRYQVSGLRLELALKQL